jgi:hypothetical protein
LLKVFVVQARKSECFQKNLKCFLPLESKNEEIPATEVSVDDPSETLGTPENLEVTEDRIEVTEDRAEATEANLVQDEAEAGRRNIFKSRPRKLDFSGKVSLMLFKK